LSGLRVPFFLVAVVLAGVVVLIELGSLILPQPAQSPEAAVQQLCAPPQHPDGCNTASGQQQLLQQVTSARASQPPTPGLGIPYLALVDGLLFWIVLLMALSLVIPARILGRLQGLASLIVSFLLILAGIGLVFVALGLLILMVSLFLAVPFGTIAYLAIWGFFDRGGASVTLSLLMTLKIAFAICMGLASQAFLGQKGLILMVVASLVANVIVAFLQGLVPIFLVSITDALAAIVVAIIGIILALLSLIGSIVAVVKALKPEV
jgi:hypothetical protein